MACAAQHARDQIAPSPARPRGAGCLCHPRKLARACRIPARASTPTVPHTRHLRRAVSLKSHKRPLAIFLLPLVEYAVVIAPKPFRSHSPKMPPCRTFCFQNPACETIACDAGLAKPSAISPQAGLHSAGFQRASPFCTPSHALSSTCESPNFSSTRSIACSRARAARRHPNLPAHNPAAAATHLQARPTPFQQQALDDNAASKQHRVLQLLKLIVRRVDEQPMPALVRHLNVVSLP